MLARFFAMLRPTRQKEALLQKGQLARTVAILARLPRAPRRIGTPDLLMKLREAGYWLDVRKLQKDLLRITDALPVTCDPGKPNRYAWEPDAAPFEVAAMEPAGALLLALVEPTLEAILPKRLAKHFATSFKAAREAATVEGLGRLTRNIRALPEALPRQRPRPKPGHIDVLLEALAQGRRVRALYKKRNARRATEYHLGPLGLVSVGPVLMVLANKVGEPRVRHFEVQRFRELRLLSEGTVGIDDFDIDAHIARGELAYPVTEAWLELDLEVGPQFADELIDAPLSPEQTVEETDGAHRVRAHVADTWALQRFILGLGAQAHVRGPASYTARIADEVARMAERYGFAGAASMDPRERVDLQRGLLVSAAARAPETLALLSNLNWQLVNWAQAKAALVLGPGHLLREGMGPDLSVYSDARMKGPPALVLDVLDGATNSRSRVRKAEWYLESGARERWLVDPKEGVAMRYVLREGVWILAGSVEGRGVLESQELGLSLAFELE